MDQSARCMPIRWDLEAYPSRRQKRNDLPASKVADIKNFDEL
jgi:hypothetical protein